MIAALTSLPLDPQLFDSVNFALFCGFINLQSSICPVKFTPVTSETYLTGVPENRARVNGRPDPRPILLIAKGS